MKSLPQTTGKHTSISADMLISSDSQGCVLMTGSYPKTGVALKAHDMTACATQYARNRPIDVIKKKQEKYIDPQYILNEKPKYFTFFSRRVQRMG